MNIRRGDLVGLLGALAFLPLPLGVGTVCFPERWFLALGPVLCYLLFETLCRITVKKYRILTATTGIIAQAAVCLFVLPVDRGLWIILPGLLYTVLLLVGLDSRRDRDRMLYRIGMLGVGMYAIAQIAIIIRRLEPNAILPVMQGKLAAAFFAFSLVMIPLWNRITVEEAVQGRTGMPGSVRRGNTVMAYALLGLTFLIALIPQIGQAFAALWNGFKRAVTALAAWLSSLLSAPTATSGAEGGGGGMEAFAMEGGEPSAAAQLLEKIMMIFALVLACAGLVFLLVLAYRKLTVLFRRLAERIRQYLQAAGEDYTDEVTDTREDGKRELTARKKKRLHASLKNERGLSPAQKVRRRYLRLAVEHPEWGPERTARENLGAEVSELYERVRYGGVEVTEEEAEAYHPEPEISLIRQRPSGP